MTLLDSIRRYLPIPGEHRRRIEDLAEELRLVRSESRKAQERIQDAIVPLGRVSEHFPLLRRELDEFVQSLSVTLRQASDRIRELDERLDEIVDLQRQQMGLLGEAGLENRPERRDLPAIGGSGPLAPSPESLEQVESLRAAVDRLAVASARTEALLEDALRKPDESRVQFAWTVAILSFAFAALAVALATLAYLR
jgi:DNA repair exonuclease SbcCD ATPase subunit